MILITEAQSSATVAPELAFAAVRHAPRGRRAVAPSRRVPRAFRLCMSMAAVRRTASRSNRRRVQNWPG